MRNLILGGLTAALLAVPGVAVAAELDEPTDCAGAVVALNQAQTKYDDAVAADDKLAKAEDNDTSLKDAKADLKDAKEKRDVAQADVTSRQAELARVKAVDPVVEKDVDNAQTALDAAKDKLKNRQDKVDDAQDARDDADKAAKPEVRKLRDKANATDADQLKTALDAAHDDFNRLCTEGTDAADVTTVPAPVDTVDSGATSQVGSVPSGGVETGSL